MIAVVQIGGHQAIVKEGEQIEVDKINAKENTTISFNTLLVSNEDGSSFQIGAPFLKDISVQAKILAHGKGDKIRVFKMKPRKRYRRTQGHRQDYTLVEILRIGAESSKKLSTKKQAVKKETKPVKKTVVKKSKTTAKKKPTTSKTTKKEVKK